MLGSYVDSLLQTAQVFAERKINWTWVNDYSSHVGDAREITLAGNKDNDVSNTKPFAGNLTYDKLIWIDSDIAWKPEDILRLYESDKDIVSGAYLFGNGTVAAYAEKLGRPYTYSEVIEMGEPTKVSGVGFGFIAIKSGVFELMSRPWFQQAEATHTINGMEYTFPVIGEDLSWCYRVQELGFDVWLDPEVKVTHHKNMKLTWEGVKP
jgi:GT2 family glycosyltransferase